MTPVRKWIGATLGAVALAPSPLLLAQQGSSNTLQVGVIGQFSAPSYDFGTPMLQGIQMAVDEINAVGGYLGRPLALVVKDDKGDPDAGLKAAQELAAQKVVATIGFCNTGVAMKALDVFQNGRMPLIVPCSTGSPVTAKYPAPESYIFRNVARDSLQAPFVVNDIVKRGWTKVAIFADTTGSGEAGLKAVHVTRFPLGVADLRTELQAARDAGANVVFSYTVGKENAVIANGRKDLGWKVPQVGAWPLSFPFFIEGAKEAADGALMAQTFIAEPSNERRAAFLSAFTRKHGKRMAVPMAAAQGYDAAYLLTYALFGIRDGKLDGPAVKFALENIRRVYYGVVATYERPFSLDDKDALTENMLVMGKVQGGAVTFAYPEDPKCNLIVQRTK